MWHRMCSLSRTIVKQRQLPWNWIAAGTAVSLWHDYEMNHKNPQALGIAAVVGDADAQAYLLRMLEVSYVFHTSQKTRHTDQSIGNSVR